MLPPTEPKQYPLQSGPNTRETGPSKRPPKRFRTAFSERLRAYGHIHAHTLLSSLGRLQRTPVSTLMTVIVIAIALAFPAGFYVLVKNVQQVSGEFTTSNQISLFLKHTVSDQAGARLADQLKQNPKVEAVTLIEKEAALNEFQTYSGFGEALDALEFNPLPVVIQIQPAASLDQPAKLEQLLDELQALNEADFAQLDMQWVERLHSMANFAERLVVLLSALLGLAVVFIIGNTIRLELQNRREEVVVTKLVGGTDGFIRRPFLYCGFWYGFLSSLLAWLIVTLTLMILQGPVRNLSALYESGFDLLFLEPAGVFVLIVVASALGVAGSWMVLAQHLHTLNPE